MFGEGPCVGEWDRAAGGALDGQVGGDAVNMARPRILLPGREAPGGG